MKCMKVKRLLVMVLAATLVFNGNIVFAAQTQKIDSISTEETRTASDVIEISTEKDLKKISDNLNGNYRLKNNIKLSGKEWYSIGTEKGDDITFFNGTFDGAGYTISNLRSTDGQGLFGALGEDAIVKNLTISGKITTTKRNTGLLAFLSMGTIINCTSIGSIKQPTYKGGSCNMGGLVACNEGYMKDCVNKANIAHDYSGTEFSQSVYGFVGGITGANNGVLENCENQGNITSKCMYSGGIIAVNKYLMRNCINKGNVTAKLDQQGVALAVGGMAGCNMGLIDSCMNRGTIFADAQMNQYDVGGIVGRAGAGSMVTFMECITEYNTNNSEINNCENQGIVQGYKGYIGGICGSANLYRGAYNENETFISNSGNFIISKCVNSGSVIDKTSKDESGSTLVGGIVANASNFIGKISILGCGNTGTITGADKAIYGGVAGMAYADVEEAELFIKNCYNTGNITGSEEFGTVVGITWPAENTDVVNVYNTGKLNGYDISNTVANCSTRTTKNCYFLADTASVETALYETALTSAQMKKASSFKGFDFNYIWEMKEQNGMLLPSIKGVGNSSKALLNKKSLSLELLDKTTKLNASAGKLVHLYSGNPTIVTVSKTGEITAKKRGTTVIYAVFQDGQIVSCPVTVAKRNVSKASVSLSKTSYQYDGNSKRPEVTVQVGNTTLVKDVDYTVSYSKNKNIGKATVTIKGRGNYTGTIKKSFKIIVKKGSVYKVDKNEYKITSSSTVAFAKLSNKKTTKFTIPKSITIGGKKFNVTSIGTSAFEGCTKLSKVTIGSMVTSIGSKAFKGCKALKSITVPSKVTTIGKEAFRNCSKLGTITIKTTKLASVGKNALKGIKTTAKIKVPAKKFSFYKNLLSEKGQSDKVKIVKY